MTQQAAPRLVRRSTFVALKLVIGIAFLAAGTFEMTTHSEIAAQFLGAFGAHNFFARSVLHNYFLQFTIQVHEVKSGGRILKVREGLDIGTSLIGDGEINRGW